MDFRLSAGDLNDESEEHHRYITELKTIKKYYAEASEMGRNISKWINRFKVNVYLSALGRRYNLSTLTTLQSASLQWESVRPLWEPDVSLRL